MAIDEQIPGTGTRRRVQAEMPPGSPVRMRRNPRWAALGVTAICLGALASFFLYSQLAESQQVVAVRHTLSRGSTIGSDDLGTVHVSDLGGVSTVPAGRLSALIGRVAEYDLVAGSLLPADAVTDELPPAKGKSVVGIRVAAGRAPSGFLAPGSPIRLVVLPTAAGGDQADPAAATAGRPAGQPAFGVTGETINATVVSSEQRDDGVFLNIELDAGRAVDAASYAAQDRVVVIRESER